MTTFSSEPEPPLFITSKSYMWLDWTTDWKEENMDTVTQAAIIGIVVSRDGWTFTAC